MMPFDISDLYVKNNNDGMRKITGATTARWPDDISKSEFYYFDNCQPKRKILLVKSKRYQIANHQRRFTPSH